MSIVRNLLVKAGLASPLYIDYSTWRPSVSTLKSAGVGAVGRYIGWDSVPGYSSIGKNVTKTEAVSLHAGGISIWLFFEYAQKAALNGAAQGAADGALATKQLADLSAPSDSAVFFTLDFDLADYAPNLPDTPANARAKLGPVAHYFDAINALKPSYKVGVYGGYYAVKRVLDAGLASVAIQTVAWSGGQWDARAVLRQNGKTAFNGNADVDVLMKSFPMWAPQPAAAVLKHWQVGGAWSLNQTAKAHNTTAAVIIYLTCRYETEYQHDLAVYIQAGDWDAMLPAGVTIYVKE